MTLSSEHDRSTEAFEFALPGKPRRGLVAATAFVLGIVVSFVFGSGGPLVPLAVGLLAFWLGFASLWSP